jgi:hypothetical protein
VCQTTSAVVLWRSEINGGSKQEFYVQYWRISQSSSSMLSPSIPDPGMTSDPQYTVNNLVPETLYIFQIITRNDYGDAFTKSVNCTTDQSMRDVVYIIILYIIRRLLLFINLYLLFCFICSILLYFNPLNNHSNDYFTTLSSKIASESRGSKQYWNIIKIVDEL